eukprot:m.191744 g.191744  ORF g.191744 m.191744 type:complete len:745 (-) comp32444_c0_seq4:51-2285(-)
MSSHESTVDSKMEPTNLESAEENTNTSSIENSPLEEVVRQGPKYTINLKSGFMKHIERHQEKRKHVEVEWKEKMSDPKRQEEVDARVKMHQAHTAKLSQAEALKLNKAPSRLAVAALRATTSKPLEKKQTSSTPKVSTTSTPTSPTPTSTAVPTPTPLSTPTPTPTQTRDGETTAAQTAIPTSGVDTLDTTNKESDSNVSMPDTDTVAPESVTTTTPLQNSSSSEGNNGRLEDGKRVRRPRRIREGKGQPRDTGNSIATTLKPPASTTNDEKANHSKSTASTVSPHEPQLHKPATKYSSRSKRPKIVAPPGRWSSQWWYHGEDTHHEQTKEYLKASMAAMELVYTDQVSFKPSEEMVSCVINIGDRTVKTKEFASQDMAEIDAVMRCCAILDSRGRLFKSESEAKSSSSIQHDEPRSSRPDRRRDRDTSNIERAPNTEIGDPTKRPSTRTRPTSSDRSSTSSTRDTKDYKKESTRTRDRRRGDGGHATNAHGGSHRIPNTHTYTNSKHNPSTNTINTNNTTAHTTANTNRPRMAHTNHGSNHNRNQQHDDRDETPRRERRERRPERELRKPSRARGQKAFSNDTTPSETVHEKQNQLETHLEHLNLGEEKDQRQRRSRNAQPRSTSTTTTPPTTTTATTTTTTHAPQAHGHTAPLSLNQRRPRQTVQHYVPRMRQKRPEPLCKFDVEMKNGQKHQLIICEGDNVENMTRVFGETHHMEGDHVETLLGYVTQELASKTLVTASTA